MTIRNKIDPRYLAIIKVLGFWKKLYWLAKPTHSEVLALAWRPRDVEVEIRGQELEDQKQKEVRFVVWTKRS